MHDHHGIAEGKRVTWAGMLVNVLLTVLKFLGGIYGRSKALLADAIHSLSDLLTDILVLIGLHFFDKKEDKNHPYGHGKVETLSTIGVGAILLLAAVSIGIGAVTAIYRGEATAPHRYTILIAAISIIAKEVLFQVTIRTGKRIGSEAMTANAWHHRSDSWTSAVTLVGVALASYVPSLRSLDSAAAIVVSLFILKISIDILRGSVSKIIDTSPSPEFLDSVREEVNGIRGVKSSHDLTGRYYADSIRMEVHIELDPDMTVRESHEIADSVAQRVKERFPEVTAVLVHVDPFEPDA